MGRIRVNQSVATEENYKRIIEYTRNRTFKYISREETVDVLIQLGIVKKRETADSYTNIISRLVENQVLRIKHPHLPGKFALYKFTGVEDKWHLVPRKENSNKSLAVSSGEAYELSKFLQGAWHGGSIHE